MDPRDFEANAIEVSGILRAIANERRLQILCLLIDASEQNVGTMVDRIGISQSALSQHLARMREDGLVACRREGQTMWYRIADARVRELMGELYRIYCQSR
jgi:ArsR family transcriptional regulator